MKILVTGGAGFLGSNLCSRLLEQGNQVICFDNLYSGREKNIEELKSNPNFSFVKGDITEKIDITGLDRIYNLACPASPPAYQKDPIFTWKTNVIGILNILELSRLNGNIPVLQTSTSEVYGDPLEHPQKESYRGNVSTVGVRACYDEGKRAVETLMFDYFRQHKTPIRIVRIFNTYGPKMDPLDGRVVSNFIVEALKNEDITIYGDGNQTRSFQYVDDLIEGLVLLMENKIGFTGPVNMGNPIEFTVKDFAEKILEMIPESSSKIVYRDLPGDDPKLRKPDISLAKEKLGWEPKTGLDEGLKKAIEYFRSEI
jgi:UDP-glucuronate decarboxylase